MTGLRRLLLVRRWMAAWLIAATVAVRVLVPVGYMPAGTGGVSLTICSGHMPATALPMSGMHHGGEHDGDRDHAEQPCGFAGLAMPSLAAVDVPDLPLPPAGLAAAPLVQLADARAPPSRGFLRPPLRGPPSIG